MYNIIAENADHMYGEAIKLLKTEGQKLMIRGSEVIDLIGVNIEIKNPRQRVITDIHRKFPIKAATAEFLWYMTTNNLVEIIEPYLKHWKTYSDDGIHVNSNYGYQWRDQMNGVIEKLRADRFTRQAVITLFDKKYSHYNGKDTVCTPNFQFFIRNDKLHLIVSSRSRDLIRGECIDQFTFTCLQELVANELGIEIGTYQNSIGSLHIYDSHYDLLETKNEIVKNDYNDLKINIKYSNFWAEIEKMDGDDFLKKIVKEKNIEIEHFKQYNL